MSETTKPRKGGRRPVAGHGRLTSPHPLAQLMKLIGIGLAVVLVAGLGIGAFSLFDTATALTDNSVALGDDEAVPPKIGEIEGGVNLLVVGTDSCEGQDLKLFPRCAHDDGGERNDVTMLVHISDNPRRVTVVSFPRDMLVPIPSCPREDGSGNYDAMSQQMINVSYSHGGLACTAKTVESLTGIDIQFAAAIRWTGVINMSDAIGGVDVCVAGDISDKANTGLVLSAGEHTLKGAEALQFLRIRHGIGDGSDLGRISNQQQFMSSLVRKLQSGDVLGSPSTLLNLASTAMKQVTEKQLVLSTSLANPAAMVQIAMALKGIPYKDMVFVQYPTVYDGPDSSRVLPVTDAADVLFTALKDNKAISLTGSASDGYGVVVKGEATPVPSASATPTATGSAMPTSTPSPSPTSDASDDVKLPSSITGTTAAQVTCTQAQQ